MDQLAHRMQLRATGCSVQPQSTHKMAATVCNMGLLWINTKKEKEEKISKKELEERKQEQKRKGKEIMQIF